MEIIFSSGEKVENARLLLFSNIYFRIRPKHPVFESLITLMNLLSGKKIKRGHSHAGLILFPFIFKIFYSFSAVFYLILVILSREQSGRPCTDLQPTGSQVDRIHCSHTHTHTNRTEEANIDPVWSTSNNDKNICSIFFIRSEVSGLFWISPDSAP